MPQGVVSLRQLRLCLLTAMILFSSKGSKLWVQPTLQQVVVSSSHIGGGG